MMPRLGLFDLKVYFVHYVPVIYWNDGRGRADFVFVMICLHSSSYILCKDVVKVDKLG